MAETLPERFSRLLKPSAGDEKHSHSGPSRVSTPLLEVPHKLKPYILAVMAFRHGKGFSATPSTSEKKRISKAIEKEGRIGASLTSLYVGISAVFSDKDTAVVAIAIRDTVYLHDFSVKHLELTPSSGDDISNTTNGTTSDATKASNRTHDIITDYIMEELASYERRVLAKFIGAGVPKDLMKMAPLLCSRLWAELDVVPVSMRLEQEGSDGDDNELQAYWNLKCVDEQADSMARKCIMSFGPNEYPLLQVGYGGLVEIDAGFHSHMCTLEDYKGTCGDSTWRAMTKYADVLKQKKTKIAFFSSTPQGGGVALMRHALVRFARVIGVQLSWYVPKPKPGVFRITKNMHNILQGVAKPGEHISTEEKKTLTDWIHDNATRYWICPGGPLRDPSDGGADVVIIDDPQMPGLVPLAKHESPTRPVLYRSHIEIRGDLAEIVGTPQTDIWQFLWENIKHADMFISHPMPSFVPKNVPHSKVAYLPATTDWLDGLNKNLNDWDRGYYGHLYNMQCLSMQMTPLKDRNSEYFIQVARFDPSKGIPDLIKSYVEFYHLLRKKGHSEGHIPQLLIVGNGSVDDPDGTAIYDATLSHLETYSPHLISHISIMRLPPNDQLLNTLLSNAHTALQLSTREGFEVKVSEALHKGVPVIATRVGGIPLQVQDHKNGFLVEPGDWKDVAHKLMRLWTEPGLRDRMGKYAAGSVSDEVGTVGNALGWFYLADKWASGGGVRPEGRWVNDLAREEAGERYKEGENRLPRASTRVVGGS